MGSPWSRLIAVQTEQAMTPVNAMQCRRRGRILLAHRNNDPERSSERTDRKGKRENSQKEGAKSRNGSSKNAPRANLPIRKLFVGTESVRSACASGKRKRRGNGACPVLQDEEQI